MNQPLSWAAFCGGLATFLLTVAEILALHQTFGEFVATPLGWAHLIVIGAAFATLIGGALGVQLPRSTRPFGDRATDPVSYRAPNSSTVNQGVAMSKWGRFLSVAGRLAPIILRETPLAPIADQVGRGIIEAQQIEGASNKDKLAHVTAIAVAAANSTNAAAGRMVIDPNLVEAEAASAISTTVQAIKLVKDAHPVPPAAVLAPTSGDALPADVPTD